MGTIREKLRDIGLAALPRAILRQPYRLGLAALPMLAKRSPEIDTLYLLRSLAGDDWLPGASDIDVLVVIPELRSPEEERFLERFQRDFSIARRVCPVIGKPLGIYTRSELEEYVAHGDVRALDAGRWRILWGRDTALPDHRSPHRKLAVDAFSEALLHHSRLHETWLSGHPIIRRAGARDVVKAVSDVLRYGAFAARPESTLPSRSESFAAHGSRALEPATLAHLSSLVEQGYSAMPSRGLAPLLAQTSRWLESSAEEALRRFPDLTEPCFRAGGDSLVDEGREKVLQLHRELGNEETVWHNRLYVVCSAGRIDPSLFEKLLEKASIVRHVAGCRTPLILGPNSFVLAQRTLFYQQYGFVKNGLVVSSEGATIVRPRIAAGVLPQLQNRRLLLPALARERFGTAIDDGRMLVTEYMPKLFHALTRQSIAESKEAALEALRGSDESAAMAIGEYAAGVHRGETPRALRGRELHAIRRVLAAIREQSAGQSTGERA